MQPTPAETPRPRPWVTVAVVIGALLLWGVVAAEFVLAAPAMVRLDASRGLRQRWDSRFLTGMGLRLAENPSALVIPFAVLLAGIGGSTWLVRHRWRARRLGTVWCAVMLLLPLTL